MQAYTDGVWRRKEAARLNLVGSPYWSSSTQSYHGDYAWFVMLVNGFTTTNAGDSYYYKTTHITRVLCAR